MHRLGCCHHHTIVRTHTTDYRPIMLMRQKGYNTGSSGFWGPDSAEQVIDVNTPIDSSSLAPFNIEVSETGTIRFAPDNPGDLDSIKSTWDMIADLLPDLGRHTEPCESRSSDVFGYATKHDRYADFLEVWVWQRGALGGTMTPLTMTMLHEGYSFGDDVYAPGRIAKDKFHRMEQLAQLEK